MQKNRQFRCPIEQHPAEIRAAAYNIPQHVLTLIQARQTLKLTHLITWSYIFSYQHPYPPHPNTNIPHFLSYQLIYNIPLLLFVILFPILFVYIINVRFIIFITYLHYLLHIYFYTFTNYTTIHLMQHCTPLVGSIYGDCWGKREKNWIRKWGYIEVKIRDEVYFNKNVDER